MNILAITTYNRLNYLKKLISSFIKTIANQNWQIIIADDGSTDGTIEYIENLQFNNIPLTLIKNNRQGVHHQFNTIIRKLETIDFDYCFKCDDDIEFIKPGWETHYINSIKKSGYDHLCHFDPTWRTEKNFKKPVVKEGLISYCAGKDVQGAFFTITPNMVKIIGYMDVENFGFRGVGHVDYTMRACRAGFNDINHPFDVVNSNEFIGHQRENYSSAMDKHLQNALERDEETKRKYELINDTSRLYIPFNANASKLDLSKENELLKLRIEALENEKQWYENTYGHQPLWLIRLGKVIKLILKK